MKINIDALQIGLKNFAKYPFDHCIVENFLDEDTASKLEADFINYDDGRWFQYENSIENKKALNDWNVFPSLTYAFFSKLISEEFIKILSDSLGIPLYADPGLHGGGWHVHGQGGNLNPHLDYSIHPKLGLQRKINIILYLSSDLCEEHGGHLGLWSHDHSLYQPDELMYSIRPKFNTAVIFDTTQNSWHGMSKPLNVPIGVFRKSIAVYYLTNPPDNVELRERALFAPRADQKNNIDVIELIKHRADSVRYSSVYRK